MFTYLDENDKRALVLAKTVGRIANLDYRNLNNVDTLEASKRLTNLRNKGYLKQEGTGNQTYYLLDNNYNILQLAKIKEVRQDQHQQLDFFDFLNLPKHITTPNTNIRTYQETRESIIKICITPHTATEIAEKLNRSPKYIMEKHLRYMVKEGLLVHVGRTNSSKVKYVVSRRSGE